MAEDRGEKTQLPTQRRLEEALRRGEIPISSEVQTSFVLIGCLAAMALVGAEAWRGLVFSFQGLLGHLHEFQLTTPSLQHDALRAVLYTAMTVGPILLVVTGSALLSGGLQSRFQTFSEALRTDWGRINPSNGFSRLFSGRAAIPALLAVVKLGIIVGLTYGHIQKTLADPIFASAVNAERIAEFLTQTAFSIAVRVTIALGVIASIDYGYQFWRHRQDLMMTREEVDEERKNTDGNPQIRSAQRQRRQRMSQRRMRLEVPRADVVLTNPTHLAVALRYDRKTMKAPMVIAKGSRRNALKIREIAQQHQVPVIENKPLARLLFRYSKVGGEIPAQLYAAVAEVLAYVYRVNRYRYYTENNRQQP